MTLCLNSYRTSMTLCLNSYRTSMTLCLNSYRTSMTLCLNSYYMYVYVYSIRQETNKFVKLCNKSHLMKDPNCVSSISGDMLQEQLTHLC